MNRIVMMMKPESISFEVRDGLCLPSAFPPVRLWCEEEMVGMCLGAIPQPRLCSSWHWEDRSHWKSVA